MTTGSITPIADAPPRPCVRLRGPSRVAPALVLLGACAVLGVAAWLPPSPTGMGTHQQLGLAPCGFYVLTGLPCPACGYTTAFALAAHGRIIDAFIAQPAGAALALLTAAAAILSAQAFVTRSPMSLFRFLLRPTVLWTLGAGVLLGWVYKLLVVSKAL